MKIRKQDIPTNTRHKLLFTFVNADNVEYLDLGYLLSKAIESHITSKSLPFIADDAVNEIIDCNTKHDEEIGSYVAIRNIGILFEPALSLNVLAKFDLWAKSTTLIVDASEGEIKDNVFFPAGSSFNDFSINLSNLSYKTLSDEI